MAMLKALTYSGPVKGLRPFLLDTIRCYRVNDPGDTLTASRGVRVAALLDPGYSQASAELAERAAKQGRYVFITTDTDGTHHFREPTEKETAREEKLRGRGQKATRRDVPREEHDAGSSSGSTLATGLPRSTSKPR